MKNNSTQRQSASRSSAHSWSPRHSTPPAAKKAAPDSIGVMRGWLRLYSEIMRGARRQAR